MKDLPELEFHPARNTQGIRVPWASGRQRGNALKTNAPPKLPIGLEKSPTVIGPWSNVRSDFSFMQPCLFLACIACTACIACHIGLEIHCRPKELTKDCRPEEVTEDFCHQIFCLWLPHEGRVLIVLVLVVLWPVLPSSGV